MLKKKLKNSLNQLFNKLDIHKGDNIIIHSNMAGLYQFNNFKLKDSANIFFFNFLKKYLGPMGTILVPTYNYQFTKKKKFNVFKSICEVGELGNFMIKKFPFNRTNDPVFSHVVKGKYEESVLNCSTNEAFGEKSIFSFILKKNFKILCFCCSVNRMTFLHFIEKKNSVNYRYNKLFKSKIFKNNRYSEFKYLYQVGNRKIDYSIKEKKVVNASKVVMKKNNFGRFICSSISAKDLYKKISKKIKSKNNFLI